MNCKVNPYEGDKPYIFFSYSHNNKDTVYPIIETLSEAGYRIWYDKGIEVGTDWPEVIAKHLVGAEVCMIAVTPSSTMSHNCNNEMNMAVEENKYIVAIQMEDFQMALGIRLQLASTQVLKAFEYSENEMYEKIYKLERLNRCKDNVSDDKPDKSENAILKFIHKSAKKKSERKAVEEENRRKAEAERKAVEEENRRKAEAERKAVEEENKRKAEAERKAVEEENRRKAEAERKAVEEENRRKTEAERKAVEEENRRKAEAERKAVKEEYRIKKEEEPETDEYIADGDTVVISDDDGDEDDGNTKVENMGVNPILVRLNTKEFFVGNYPMTSIGRKKYLCDLYFNVDTISSPHADILIHEGTNYLIDHESLNGTYVNNKKLKSNEQVTIDGFAEIMLSRAEKFIVAFDDYADWITENMCLVSLVSVKTHERKYIFENETIMGRSSVWHSEAMKDMRIGRQHAIFHIRDGECYCEDNSQNGTFRVTGNSEERLPKNKPVRLKDGDKLRFGREYFIFNHYILKEGVLS